VRTARRPGLLPGWAGARRRALRPETRWSAARL